MKIKVLGATLLSIEEYEENKNIIKNVDLCWWLRSPGFSSDFASFVDVDGAYYDCGDGIRFDIFAVRPALILETENLKIGSHITYAGQKFTVLRDGLALCDKPIHQIPFREDWKEADANLYEASDVKKWVDAWFSKNGDTAETFEENQP